MEVGHNLKMMNVKINSYKLEQNTGKQIMVRQMREQVLHVRRILQRMIGIPQKLETVIIRMVEQQILVK